MFECFDSLPMKVGRCLRKAVARQTLILGLRSYSLRCPSWFLLLQFNCPVIKTINADVSPFAVTDFNRRTQCFGKRNSFVTMQTLANERKTVGMNGSKFIENFARQMTAELQAIRDSIRPGSLDGSHLQRSLARYASVLAYKSIYRYIGVF